MFFRPLKFESDKSALLGAADAIKFVDVYRDDIDRSLYEKRIHSPEEKRASMKYTIIVIIISAIIFVTIISIYDIFRNIISNHYAEIALEDPNADNKSHDIKSTLIANRNALTSSIMFSLFCIITGTITIYILIKFI
jgi:hypothetical protein